MQFTIEKLYPEENRIALGLLSLVLGSSLIYLGLTAENFPPEEIKNLGNVVYSSDAENIVKDLSFIPDDNDAAVSGTITVIATNSNGEVLAIRQGLG